VPWTRTLTGADHIQELTNQAKRINLIVVFTGWKLRKAQ